MKILASEKFTLTLGRNPGYAETGKAHEYAPIDHVKLAWQRLMEAEGATSGVFVPALVREGVACYAMRHGCPEGGESVAVIEGTCNPAHVNVGEWRVVVLRLCWMMKTIFDQVTAQVDFQTVELHYLEEGD